MKDGLTIIQCLKIVKMNRGGINIINKISFWEKKFHYPANLQVPLYKFSKSTFLLIFKTSMSRHRKAKKLVPY